MFPSREASAIPARRMALLKRSVDLSIEAKHHPSTGQRYEFDFLRVAWFETHSRSGGNIQPKATRRFPVKSECGVRLVKMEMTTDLNRSIPRIRNGKDLGFKAGIYVDVGL
jgi:hypothetical protein